MGDNTLRFQMTPKHKKKFICDPGFCQCLAEVPDGFSIRHLITHIQL